jgi:hypothetical protein
MITNLIMIINMSREQIISSTDWIYNPFNVIMRIKVNPSFSNFMLLEHCIKKNCCYFGSGCVIKLLNLEKVLFNVKLPGHYKYFLNCEMLSNEDLVICTIEKLYSMITKDDKYQNFRELIENKTQPDFVKKLYGLYILNRLVNYQL